MRLPYPSTSSGTAWGDLRLATEQPWQCCQAETVGVNLVQEQ